MRTGLGLLGLAVAAGGAKVRDVDCLLLQVAVQFEGHGHAHHYECEELGTDGLSLFRLDEAELDAAFGLKNVRSGVSRVRVKGAVVDGLAISLAGGAKVTTIDPDQARRRATIRQIGTSNILILRVTTNDGTVQLASDEISRRWFGGYDDAVNCKSQYDACSFGQLTFDAATGTNIVDGVAEVSVNADAIGTDIFALQTSAATAAAAVVGSLSNFDHVAYCVPEGTTYGVGRSSSWIGFAYFNNQRSVYNDDWCGYVSIQMHEIGEPSSFLAPYLNHLRIASCVVGHNLNLMHAGLLGQSSQYGD